MQLTTSLTIDLTTERQRLIDTLSEKQQYHARLRQTLAQIEAELIGLEANLGYLDHLEQQAQTAADQQAAPAGSPESPA